MTAVFFLVSLSGALVSAQDRAAEAAAKESLEAFIAAWNMGDDVQLRKTMNFPFVTFGAGQAVRVAERAEDFTQGFEQMRQKGWARSSFDFDSFTVYGSSAEKVHCEIGFSRYRADGTPYFTGRVMYVVTNQDGHWGPQLRTAGSPVTPLAGGQRAEVLDAARRAALEFMTAFNAGDAEGATGPLNYPHLFLFSSGTIATADDAGHSSVRPDFNRMRSSQNWHVSTFDSLEASIVSENKVHLEVVFSRWHPDGTRYLTIPALWIVTRVGDHWGVQLRSLMPATFRE